MPRPNCTKINVDAAFNIETGKGAAGIVCRDERGRILTMSASKIYVSSPLQAEAIGLRDAVTLGMNLHLEDVIFETDNLDLVEACRENKKFVRLMASFMIFTR